MICALTRVLLPIAATALALAAQLSSSPGYSAYEHANRLFVEKRLPECQAALEESLRVDARLVPALTLKAKVAMSLNRFDVARESLEKALAADPASTYAQFLYGLQFYMENDLQSALPQFEKSVKLNPRDARATLYLGLTLESLGNTADAMTLYEKANRLEQAALGAAQPDVLLPGARLLMLLGRLPESEAWIRKALKAAPGLRDAHFQCARLLLASGRAAEAAEEGEGALLLPGEDVTDTQVRYLLIRIYRDLGNAALVEKHAAALTDQPGNWH